jgi:hypothetical protein
VRLTGRRLVQRGVHDRRDLLLTDLRLAPPPRPHPTKALQPFVGKALPPRLDRRRRDANPRADRGVGLTVAGQQQRTRALDLAMLGGPGPGEPLEHLALTVGDL